MIYLWIILCIYTITGGQGLFTCLIVCVTDRLIWADQSFHIVFRTGVFLLLAAVTFKSRALRCQENRDHLSSTLCLFSISSLSLFVWRASGRCTGLYLSDSNQEEVAFMMETDCIHPLWAERIWSWDPWQWDKTFWWLFCRCLFYLGHIDKAMCQEVSKGFIKISLPYISKV